VLTSAVHAASVAHNYWSTACISAIFADARTVLEGYGPHGDLAADNPRRVAVHSESGPIKLTRATLRGGGRAGTYGRTSDIVVEARTAAFAVRRGVRRGQPSASSSRRHHAEYRRLVCQVAACLAVVRAFRPQAGEWAVVYARGDETIRYRGGHAASASTTHAGRCAMQVQSKDGA